MSAATPSAYPNPAQPAEMSKAGTPVAPNAAATAGRTPGLQEVGAGGHDDAVDVGGPREALAIASRPASVAIEAADSSRAANRRVLIPVRE